MDTATIIGKIVIDDRLDAYANIFPSAIGKELGEAAAVTPTIRRITDKLLMNWRAAAYVAGMPSQFPVMGKAVFDGFAGEPVSDTQLVELASAIVNKLISRIPEVLNYPSLTNELRKETANIAAELRESIETARRSTTFPVEKAWRDYLTAFDFAFYVWDSQRSSLLSVFNTYENFVSHLADVARPRTDNGERINERIKAAFGQQIAQ